jgi:two-component system chemotaxis sensor kinase CheA
MDRNSDKSRRDSDLIRDEGAVRFDITPSTLKKLPVTHEFLYILAYDLSVLQHQKGTLPLALFKELLSVGNIAGMEIRVFPDDLRDGLPEGPLWCILLYSTILGPEFIDDAVGLSDDHIYSLDRENLADTDAITFDIGTGRIEMISSDANMPYAPESGDSSYPDEISDKFQSTLLDSLTGGMDDLHGRERHEPADVTIRQIVDREDIRADMEKLDQLVNLVGELVISESMVTKNPDLEGLKRDNFDRSVHNLRRIIGEIRKVVMSARMISLSRTFKNMARLVSDLSSKSGKQIRVEMKGEDTEVDKTVSEQISAPLSAIISNRVENAIELPDERKKAGKPPAGILRLEANHEGSEIHIRVSDDGRSLSRHDILARASEMGLVTGDAGRLSDEEVYNLLFENGFAGADASADGFPGARGLGRVKKNLERLKGRVEVRREEDAGTTVVLKIPLTMAIIEGMLIRVGGIHYTIPLLSIRESFRPAQDQITVTMDGQEIVKVRNRLIPVIRIHSVYNITPKHERLDEGILIRVKAGAKNACLFADEIIGHHQTVIKEMPAYIGSTSGIAGCTILDDGTVGLILDVEGIAEMAGQRK